MEPPTNMFAPANVFATIANRRPGVRDYMEVSEHTHETAAESASRRASRPALRFTPFHVGGFFFLAAGLGLAVYDALGYFGVVPEVAWLTWSHIHFVTIGGFTQLIVGMLPQLAARKLDRPTPSIRYTWANFLALNGAFALVWYGRAYGETFLYDVGVVVIMAVVVGLFLYLAVATVRGTPRARGDATVRLYLLSPLVFLFGLAMAFELFSHPGLYGLPGGWWDMREAHVHANAWGFLGFAAIGTLYDVFPRLVDADLYSERLKGYSFWFLAAGIGPLSVGPAIAMGRSVTATGLVLFAAGYLLFVYNLVRTYRAGTPSGLSLSVLVAQAWILGPAGFAPFILFGVPIGIPEKWIEAGALHFFFLGWALPVAFAGLAISFRNLPCSFGRARELADPPGLLPDASVPASLVRPWLVVVWNAAVLLAGIGFFYQDQAWSGPLHAVGFSAIAAIWAYYLWRIGRQRWTILARARRA